MARIGRPRSGDEPLPQRAIRMDGKTWDRLGDAAKEGKTSRSAIIRDAVTKHLDEQDQKRGK